MFYDSHCHLDFAAFDADRTAVLERAERAGVSRVLVPGVAPAQWEKLPALRAAHPAVVGFGVGLHPAFLPAADERAEALDGLADAATRLGATAIGECGLDGVVARDGPDLDVQSAVLEAHLAVARALALPVILHVLRAHGRALDILRRHAPLRGVVHSYSGGPDLVGQYVDLGLHIGFAASVTRPNAKKPRAAARQVPIDRLLVETDAPDQPPTGADADRNEPALLVRVVAAVANARSVALEEVARHTAENAAALFGR